MITGISVGGGVEQVPSIIKAKELGYHVVVVDRNPSAPGLSHADEAAIIDIKNEEEVIQYAREKKVSFVIPAPIGRFITTVGAVNDALHLIGISRKCAVNCADKIIFNHLMRTTKIPVPEQISVEADKKSVMEALQNISEFPCIIKPQYGSGSRAIFIIDNQGQLQRFMNNWNDYSGHLHKDEQILIEQFIDGIEYGVDAVRINGEFYLILVRKKVLNSHHILIEYESPAKIKEAILEQILQNVKNAIEALTLDNCLINADVIVEKTSKTPYIIELTGRPAGLFIYQKIIPYVTGTDFLEVGINLSLGKHLPVKIQEYKQLVLSFFPFSGKLLSKPQDREIANIADLVEYHFPFKSGDFVPEIISTRDILDRGWVSFTGKSLGDAQKNIRKFLSKFVLS